MQNLDKEAQEKLNDILTRYGNFVDSYDVDGDALDIDEALVAIVSLIDKLGYRKLPQDGPPLLSDKELADLVRQAQTNNYSFLDGLRRIAQAQRVSDIKFYEGK